MPTLLIHRCCWARFRHIVSQDVHACRDTLVADHDGRPSNEFSHLIPGLTAKGTLEIVANSRLVLAHRRIWSLHSYRTTYAAIKLDGLLHRRRKPRRTALPAAFMRPAHPS